MHDHILSFISFYSIRGIAESSILLKLQTASYEPKGRGNAAVLNYCIPFSKGDALCPCYYNFILYKKLHR